MISCDLCAEFFFVNLFSFCAIQYRHGDATLKELQTQVLPLHLRVMAGLIFHLLSVLLPASPALLPGQCVIIFCGVGIEW